MTAIRGSNVYDGEIREHAVGILAYLNTKMTNGPVEGINNKLRVIARRSVRFPIARRAHLDAVPLLVEASNVPTGLGLRPDCESAGLATDPLPATRLSSTLHESGRYPYERSGGRLPMQADGPVPTHHAGADRPRR